MTRPITAMEAAVTHRKACNRSGPTGVAAMTAARDCCRPRTRVGSRDYPVEVHHSRYGNEATNSRSQVQLLSRAPM